MKKLAGAKTKKSLTAAWLAILSAGMLMGCGSGAVTQTEETTAQVEEDTTQTEEVAEQPEVNETAEEEEEGGVVTPFLDDMEKYESILSTVTTDQYYAFAAVGEGEDVLLVTDGVFENADGSLAAIDAKVYAFADDGKIYEAGSVWSDGTAYPIAVADGHLMFGGNHHMSEATIMDGSVVVLQTAHEEFDEDGNATYSIMKDLEETIVDDNSILTEMFDKYNNAIVINFTQGEAAADTSSN